MPGLEGKGFMGLMRPYVRRTHRSTPVQCGRIAQVVKSLCYFFNTLFNLT